MASHEGFALRMPPSDIANWQMTNDKGELVDIPRPAVALRVDDRYDLPFSFLFRELTFDSGVISPSTFSSIGHINGSISLLLLLFRLFIFAWIYLR